MHDATHVSEGKEEPFLPVDTGAEIPCWIIILVRPNPLVHSKLREGMAVLSVSFELSLRIGGYHVWSDDEAINSSHVTAITAHISNQVIATLNVSF